VSERNGKPPPDVNALTPNDFRRLRVKLDGRDPQELLGGELEDVIQVLTLAYLLREDPAATWGQAGDIAPSEMFDMGGQSPPETETPTPAASGSRPKPNAAKSSKRKRVGSGPAPSSAASTESAVTSTMP
jgi:hypothetical protein